ncbi:glycosyltransferase family 4 protein [Mangrovibacterium diazotrophicum]|uniref:Glycosyltransferase involved in cell wall biosynthesis n=1 Tax=Mangrovibacterium diazotrophicum TaxID=1261403 RepID=A0A419VXA9_9BACT|nr:glycosyltransferase family 4 protein [Mangrovibacterium diazotrophicum]RKD87720.1 glycosyltransferase involved in cell wall biosynthesis [Mangrovibacterium diazotrophicum]
MEKITICLWQNSVSPHQIPYIKHLNHGKNVRSVILIVPQLLSANREKLGWSKNFDADTFELIIAPNKDKIREIYTQNTNSIHLFSGIRANQWIFDCFKSSLAFPNLKRGIITEGPLTYKKPLMLHKIRFLIQDYRYVRHYNYVFAIGEDAENYYKSWSSHWKVIPFAYCVDENRTLAKLELSPLIKLLFVGNLTERKNVKLILQALKTCKNKALFHLSIVGDGDQREMLETYVKSNNLDQQVSFKGSSPINQIPKIMDEHDCLILPSVHDGWGAVVNEGLHAGLYVLCSDRCGAKALLSDSERGLIFKSNNTQNLVKSLQDIEGKISEIRSNRPKRQAWSEKSIGGQAIAEYLVSCLTSNTLPKAPWKIDNK